MKGLKAAAVFGLVGTLMFAGYTRLQAEPTPDAKLPDGSHYFGPLVDGLLHGQGRLERPNGDWYEGHFKQGEKSGQGHMESATGFVYLGEFRSGMFHGKGRMETLWGGVYEGEFAQDSIVKGTLTGPGGDRYEGKFLGGTYHGQGRLEWPGGQVWEGKFKKGDFVEGRLEDTDGVEYEGEFVDWALQGKGRYTTPDGSHYKGEFIDHLPHGEGVLHSHNGDIYRGIFENGQFSGKGRLEYANGDIWDGWFRHGYRHGSGKLTPADGSEAVEGYWVWDEPKEGDADRNETPPQVENLLYNQPALLEAAFESLQPSDPDHINLYLLSVGGDGSQEVFRREVEFVSELFDERFGTLNRSLILTNSRTTHNQFPMATATSLGLSLAALSEAMDNDNDILFVFLTSHGSSDHEFSINQNGMQLPDINAGQLAEVLNVATPKWQVVVVSACYSGGFVEPLKNDRRMIITASSADRQSFGCSDEADMTYFGRAFFDDALAETRDFTAAFTRAVELVTEREEEGGYSEHSRPQIHAPPTIVDRLTLWREQFESP